MKKIITLILYFFCFQFLQAQTADYYFNVLSPSSIYTSYDTTQFSRVTEGWGWNGLLNGSVTGELVYAPEGLSGLHTLCDSVAIDYTDKLVLIDRGECEFSLKVLNAELQGAAAVILVNFDDEVIFMAGGQSGAFTTIPVIMLKQSSGAPIIAELNTGATVMAELSPNPNPIAKITGTVVADENDNCESDGGEPLLDEWRVEAEKNGNINYTFTNAIGEYILFLDTGIYNINLVPPANGLWGTCDGETVTFTNFDSTNVDLQAFAIIDCPQLNVDIETPLVRRCFDNNTYWVKYCNLGTVSANDAYVQITLDPLISIVSTSLPYTDLGGNQYEFPVGDVEVGECASFNIVYEVSCDAVFGEAICAVAEIFPDTLCVQPAGNWTGADVLVNGSCDGEEVLFVVSNVGTGDMTEPADYHIVRNEEMIESGTFQLSIGATQSFSFPADGSTYRLEAGQVNDYPESTLPAASVEGCVIGGGEFEVGYVTMFPPPNYGANYDEECEEVIGSYDPNDKKASPKGYGDEQYIEANTDITYLIRFQNTGTDTAFNIKIKDTLSVFLDPNSIRPENSSHPYEFEIDDERIAVFTFPFIMLPDSNVNEPLSHGFVSFQISQVQDVPLNTQILNSAAIYFDFNAPVITNEYFHTIGKDFLPSSAVTVLRSGLKVDVFPNPMGQETTFDLGEAQFKEGVLKVYDAMGRPVETNRFDQSRFQLKRGEWAVGNYFFQIMLDGEHVASGQLLIQ